MKRLLIISLFLTSSAFAYIDQRGFPSQGTPVRDLRNMSSPARNVSTPVSHPHNRPSTVIINQYQVYPVILENDAYEYIPDDSFFEEESSPNISTSHWVRANDGKVPANAVVSKVVQGRAVYHCRAISSIYYYNGTLIPGRGCYVRDFNKTTNYHDYEVLVED